MINMHTHRHVFIPVSCSSPHQSHIFILCSPSLTPTTVQLYILYIPSFCTVECYGNAANMDKPTWCWTTREAFGKTDAKTVQLKKCIKKPFTSYFTFVSVVDLMFDYKVGKNGRCWSWCYISHKQRCYVLLYPWLGLIFCIWCSCSSASAMKNGTFSHFYGRLWTVALALAGAYSHMFWQETLY